MLIFWKERLVVLAVPKTGTTALEEELGPRADIAFRHPPALKHANVDQLNGPYARLFRPFTPDDFQFVGVMRNPIDWLQSWHRYRSREEIKGTERSTAGVDFNSFVRAYLAKSRPKYARIGSQARFLQGKTHQYTNTMIFDYAHIAELYRYLEQQLGRTLSVKIRNTSPQLSEQNLDPDLEVALRAAYPQDFALYQQLHA